MVLVPLMRHSLIYFFFTLSITFCQAEFPYICMELCNYSEYNKIHLVTFIEAERRANTILIDPAAQIQTTGKSKIKHIPCPPKGPTTVTIFITFQCQPWSHGLKNPFRQTISQTDDVSMREAELLSSRPLPIGL